MIDTTTKYILFNIQGAEVVDKGIYSNLEKCLDEFTKCANTVVQQSWLDLMEENFKYNKPWYWIKTDNNTKKILDQYIIIEIKLTFEL